MRANDIRLKYCGGSVVLPLKKLSYLTILRRRICFSTEVPLLLSIYCQLRINQAINQIKLID